MTSDVDLAAQVKAWRGKMSAREAAEILGIPRRTFENIEQGRGFPYPRLLRIAMRATDPNDGKLLKASEFDRRFDAGEDVSTDVDWTKSQRPGLEK